CRRVLPSPIAAGAAAPRLKPCHRSRNCLVAHPIPISGEAIMFSRLPLLRQIVCGAVWRTNLRAAEIVCVATLLAPSLAHACACGCGVFGVGTLPLLPSGTGGTAFFEYDFMDQNRNW